MLGEEPADSHLVGCPAFKIIIQAPNLQAPSPHGMAKGNGMIKQSSKDALAASRSNRYSKWTQGDASAKDRLSSPICIPFTAPSFQIKQDDSIFTIGSCFARNVEEQLTRHHKKPLSAEIDIPNADILTARRTGIVNKYNSRSMLQELAWAAGEAYPLEAFIDKKGAFYDPHIRNKISDCSIDELAIRREHIRNYFAQAFTADIFVVTLGLSEYWLDEKTGLALNETPPAYCLKSEPDRFSFCIADVHVVLADLNAMRQIIQRNGNPECRIVVTTSPVPLGRTFTGHDVLIANMHSKSTLRVAALQFAEQHASVDYYPSYEAAMLSDPRVVWTSDRLHVSNFMVGKLITEFLSRYGVKANEINSDDGVGAEQDLITSLRKECDRLANEVIRLENARAGGAIA